MHSLETKVAGVRMRTPLMAMSGIFGTDYTELLRDMPGVGSIVTKSVTLNPRLGNREPRIIETRAGLLNAIGLHNPGIDGFLDHEIPKLRALEVPVVVSVAGSNVNEYVECCARVAPLDEVEAIELNVSCPNVEKGVQFGCDGGILEELVAKVRPVVDGKTLIVKLTPNVTDIAVPAQAAINGGADAISLINTLHGMAIDLETMKPSLGNEKGGLSGIGIHPVAVYMVHRCYSVCCKKNKIPIIGIGGVASWEEAVELMLAGAACVGIGTAMFRDPMIFEAVAKGIEDYLVKKGESSVSAIVGRAA